MTTPPIRTITLGLEDAHPLTGAIVERATAILDHARQTFIEAGYEVQTVRLSTRPVFDDLADWSAADMLDYALKLQRMLDDVGLGFCSLGPFNAVPYYAPVERIGIIADILIATTALNAAVLASSGEDGANNAMPMTARVIQRLARETDEGSGNFRFALLSQVEPGTPFFPAAYHNGASSIAIGLQGAGLVADALRAHNDKTGIHLSFLSISSIVKQAVEAEGRTIVELARELAGAHELAFGGIDLSPAPMGEDSIVTAIEQCRYGKFGEPGTLTVAAALTSGLRSVDLPTCGYCGLMLPVLEDAALGRRWEEGLVSIEKLLLYSAVCGTGLDTIPLPGDMDEGTIANILRDVAALATRLHKPLSARLFPVPDKKRGERTAFTSPYLTNTTI